MRESEHVVREVRLWLKRRCSQVGIWSRNRSKNQPKGIRRSRSVESREMSGRFDNISPTKRLSIFGKSVRLVCNRVKLEFEAIKRIKSGRRTLLDHQD